jgi:hypothetical protein
MFLVSAGFTVLGVIIPSPTRIPKQMAGTQLCCKRPKGKAAIRPNKIAVTASRLMAIQSVKRQLVSKPSHSGSKGTTPEIKRDHGIRQGAGTKRCPKDIRAFWK